MRFTKIRIKNFKSIKDSGEITDITKIFALIGRNNSGKSTILKAFEILLNERDIEDADFHKHNGGPIEIVGLLTKSNEQGESEETQLGVTATLSEGKVKITFSVNGAVTPNTKYKTVIPKLLQIDDIREPSDSQTGGQKKTTLKKIIEAVGMPNGKAERYKELLDELADIQRENAENLSKIITDKFASITRENDCVVQLLPELNVEKSTIYTTNLINTGVADAVPVDILNCGTGLQSMYILALLETYAEAAKDENVILIIEEPEVYLHPEYQRRMFAAIRRIAYTNQVIFSTHSPIMIADIWLTESVRQVHLNTQGETEVENVKIETVIDELGIRYEDILNSSLIMFVEGPGDIEFYKAIGISDPRIRMISSDSFRAIHYYAYIKILSSEYVQNDFVIVADSDNKDPAQLTSELINKIEKEIGNPPAKLSAESIKKRIFFLKKYAIESYFLTEAILTSLFPDISDTDARLLISEYEQHFAEQSALVQAGSLNEYQFNHFLKPKNIFRQAKNAREIAAFETFWAGKDNFLRVRQLIENECRARETAGRDWFKEALLILADTHNPELEEIRASVLAFLPT